MTIGSTAGSICTGFGGGGAMTAPCSGCMKLAAAIRIADTTMASEHRRSIAVAGGKQEASFLFAGSTWLRTEVRAPVLSKQEGSFLFAGSTWLRIEVRAPVL